MAVATFDTLKFANTLKDAGVPPQQAEAEARAFAEVIQLNLKDLANKDDLAALGKDLKQETKDAEQRLNSKIDSSVADLKLQLAQVRNEQVIVRWMLGATFGGVLLVLGLLARLFVVLPR